MSYFVWIQGEKLFFTALMESRCVFKVSGDTCYVADEDVTKSILSLADNYFSKRDTT